jgi:hypothetical protein
MWSARDLILSHVRNEKGERPAVVERDLTLILAKDMIEKELSNPQKKNREEREALTVALRMITVLSKPESMLPEILQGRPITQEEYEQARIFVDLCLGRVGYRRRP